MGLFNFFSRFFSSGKTTPKKKKTRKKTTRKNVESRAVAAKKPPKGSKRAKTEKKKIAPKIKKTKKASDAAPFILEKSKGKKRKKTKQIKTAPVNTEALGFTVSLKKTDELSKKRKAIRIRVDGLEVHVHRLQKNYAVTDISATGMSFAFKKPRIKGGIKLKMDMYLNGEMKISNLLCKVMRHERGSVGCMFVDLDRSQDDIIHGIVLLGQKQQADRKRKQKDKNFKLPC